MNSLFYSIALILPISANSAESGILGHCSKTESPQIEVIKRVQPRYPTSPAFEGWPNGWVKLEVLVAPNGKPIKITVIDSMPKGKFERSARKALNKWLFSTHNKEEIRCGLIVLEFKVEE